VLHVLEATEGGTRRHLRDLALGLRAAGWDVDAAVSRRRDPSFGRDAALLQERGARLFDVPMRRRPAPLADAAAFLRLWALLRRERPDLVHTHASKAGWLGRAAARLAGIPAVHTPHGFAFAPGRPAAGRGFYRQCERLAATWTARLIAVCDHEARLARGLGFEDGRVVRVYNGIEADGDGAAATLQSASAPQRSTVGFIGRLCRQKAPDTLLQALPAIRRSAPETSFVFMGSGDPRPLRRLAERLGVSGVVAFRPAGDGQAVAAFLRGCDVLAMPSRWEAFPYTLLEALAAGTPVVATAVGGVPEAARHGEEALLVPPDDPVALAAEIVRLLSDAALRQRLVAAGRLRAAAFPLAGMVAGVESVYRAVLREAHLANAGTRRYDPGP
jgi:glycosyltransferase involved in cell wall biosynthesis